MKLILKDAHRYVIRFDYDEEFISVFKDFCEKNGIVAGFFTGLGATSDVDLQSFDLDTKEYAKQNFKEIMEVVNLTGNISKKDAETIIHCHGSFGRENFETLSGHVSRLIVSATLEVHLTVLDGKMERKLDAFTSLNLMDWVAQFHCFE